MRILFDKDLLKKIGEIKKRNMRLYTRIEKQLILFEKNPKHHSLRTHKLAGNLRSSWSISLDRSYRMIYRITSSGDAYFYMMGTHKDVYIP
ncbi:MAG: type II toxin-antitoxin system mRNA interferase toxin, RelE/StbE family [Candidatus Pacebacteria bacterium]|nr:type II toxin-antitoxin system mRNA interferase toxin, RelE/StbE family [Candidatus Paceibacterota bacterium]